MNSPLVSVIVPCRNTAAWVADTVASVLGQRHDDLELLVVDDGSDDGSMERVAAVADARVHILEGGGRGACAARNVGLAAARGALIQFLDADDLLAPDKIALQVMAWRRYGDDFAYFGPYGRFVDDPAFARFHPSPIWADMSGLDWMLGAWRGGGMMAPHSWLVPRPLAERAGPWDETLLQNQDGEYFSRVLLSARGVRYCDGARCYYRCGQPHSVSRRTDHAARASRLRSIELVAGRILAVEDSTRTRLACANAFEEFMFLSYPAMPDLSGRAADWARTLGGGDGSKPGRGPLFRMLARFFGWRLTRRLQTVRHRLLPRSPDQATRWS